MFTNSFLRQLIALLVFACTGVVQAQTTVEVFPTGMYPEDVMRVDAALASLGDGVDGIIVLKACNEFGEATDFNFGTDPDPAQRGQVEPRSDWTGAIEFRGELCGKRRTVIEGGYNTISTNRHDRITISGIEFRGAYDSAISIRETTGAQILNNVLTDSVGNFEDTIVTPILIRANVNGSRDEITGSLEIRGNRIEGASGWFSQGIALVTTNADILVADNRVSGVNVGVLLSIYQQRATLVSNDIVAEVPRANFFAAGMQLNSGQDPTASVNVSANRIAVADADDSGEAYGILGTAYDGNGGDFRNSLIYGNLIDTKNVYVGIALTIDGASRTVADNIIARNTLVGSVPYGIALYVYDGSGRLQDNRLSFNHLSGMTPGIAVSHIWLGSSTRDTLCAVEVGNIVTDHGVNNVIIN